MIGTSRKPSVLSRRERQPKSVRNPGRAVFVDQRAGVETLDRERLGQRMHLALGQAGGEYVARTRSGLEAAGAPTAVEEQVLHRGLGDDRAGVRRGVDDAAPLAVH